MVWPKNFKKIVSWVYQKEDDHVKTDGEGDSEDGDQDEVKPTS